MLFEHFKKLSVFFCILFIFSSILSSQSISQYMEQMQDQIYSYDLDQYMQSDGEACSIMDPDCYKDVKPEHFTTTDGKTGWVIILPEGLPLATPAYDDGLIFLGGGFGSYSFYAIDAKTGEIAWAVNTGDDGPTAAVVKNGIVVFNTESCIIYALRARNGRDIWHHWLGDPLMSQPAISGRRVYMAYPGDRTHILICLDLFTGETYWKKPIKSDIISAPVIDGEEVYLATFDGMIYCYSAESGEELWKENYNATSAPWLFEGDVFTSLRQNEKVFDEEGVMFEQRYEGIARLNRETGLQENERLFNYQQAHYLHADRESRWALEQQAYDADVGFSTAPVTAKLVAAEENVGVWSVSGAWSYQGSRPVIYDGDCFNSQGNTLQRLDPDDGTILWKWEYTDSSDYGRALTPPSIVDGHIFVGSNNGDIICLNANDGDIIWEYNCGEPILFQPVIMDGLVLWATATGKVFCIDTGDKDLTGWAMWGGNASHNGWVE